MTRGFPFQSANCIASQSNDALKEFLRKGSILALTGAGISTDSGIPDYRGPETIKKRRKPIQHMEFIRSEAARKRYWARSSFGWPRIRNAEPNSAHLALARLERSGTLIGCITQNVDRLHLKAGSHNVLEIHGSLYEVVCLDCGKKESRASVQKRILELNSAWFSKFRRESRWRNSDGETEPENAPDGDAELSAGEAAEFFTPFCKWCGGILKPDVVFFGDSVPKPKVTRAWEMFGETRSLLVLGSSLTVYSGFRFVDRAVKEGKPVAIINDGQTRGDPVATIKINARLSELFQSELVYSSLGDTY